MTALEVQPEDSEGLEPMQVARLPSKVHPANQNYQQSPPAHGPLHIKNFEKNFPPQSFQSPGMSRSVKPAFGGGKHTNLGGHL